MASEQDVRNLAWTMLGEANPGDQQGMAAVGNTVLNRLSNGGYGSSITNVVKAPNAYAAWGIGAQAAAQGNNPSGRFPVGSPQFNQAYALAQQLVAGNVPDVTGGAVNYRQTTPGTRWANGSAGTVSIGGNTFQTTHPVPPASIPNQTALNAIDSAAPGGIASAAQSAYAPSLASFSGWDAAAPATPLPRARPSSAAQQPPVTEAQRNALLASPNYGPANAGDSLAMNPAAFGVAHPDASQMPALSNAGRDYNPATDTLMPFDTPINRALYNSRSATDFGQPNRSGSPDERGGPTISAAGSGSAALGQGGYGSGSAAVPAPSISTTGSGSAALGQGGYGQGSAHDLYSMLALGNAAAPVHSDGIAGTVQLPRSVRPNVTVPDLGGLPPTSGSGLLTPEQRNAMLALPSYAPTGNVPLPPQDPRSIAPIPMPAGLGQLARNFNGGNPNLPGPGTGSLSDIPPSSGAPNVPYTYTPPGRSPPQSTIINGAIASGLNSAANSPMIDPVLQGIANIGSRLPATSSHSAAAAPPTVDTGMSSPAGGYPTPQQYGPPARQVTTLAVDANGNLVPSAASYSGGPATGYTYPSAPPAADTRQPLTEAQRNAILAVPSASNDVLSNLLTHKPYTPAAQQNGIDWAGIGNGLTGGIFNQPSTAAASTPPANYTPSAAGSTSNSKLQDRIPSGVAGTYGGASYASDPYASAGAGSSAGNYGATSAPQTHTIQVLNSEWSAPSPFSNPGVQGLSPDDRQALNDANAATAMKNAALASVPKYINKVVPITGGNLDPSANADAGIAPIPADPGSAQLAALRSQYAAEQNPLGHFINGVWSATPYGQIANTVGGLFTPQSTAYGAPQSTLGQGLLSHMFNGFSSGISSPQSLQALAANLTPTQKANSTPAYLTALNSGQSSYTPAGSNTLMPTTTTSGGFRYSYGDSNGGSGSLSSTG
jgi:hypothetical protein